MLAKRDVSIDRRGFSFLLMGDSKSLCMGCMGCMGRMGRMGCMGCMGRMGVWGVWGVYCV